MPTMTSELHSLSTTRIKSFVWPREHGAWGILLVPLVTCGSIRLRTGEGIGWLLAFALTALALFCLR